MSYILDALKKSERQRRLGHELFFKQVAPGSIAGSRRWVLVTLVVALLLAGAIAAVWLERPEPPPPAETAATPVTASAPALPVDPPSAPALSRDISAPPQVAAAPMQDLAEQARVPVAASGPVRRAAGKAAASGDVPWLSSLPEAFRRSLPSLVVNIHVYAPDEAQRILYINNRPVHRGEAVQGGVMVEDIMEDGVVFEYRGQRFKVPRPS